MHPSMSSASNHALAIPLAFRAAATACVAYGIASLLRLPQPLWAPVSALIVLQGSPGRTLRAMADRVLGTLLGAATAVLAAVGITPLGAPLVVQMALAVALAALAVALIRPGARVATWTSVIVLMSTVAPGHPAMNALWRVAGVAVGAVIAAAAGALVRIELQEPVPGPAPMALSEVIAPAPRRDPRRRVERRRRVDRRRRRAA
jgi:uncharacterized membrane protein YccC